MSKILFLTKQVSGRGGMESVMKIVVNRWNEFCDSNDEVFLWIFDIRPKKSKDVAWLNEIKAAEVVAATSWITPLRKLEWQQRFAAFVRNYEPDIVICLDQDSCRVAHQVRKKTLMSFKIFSWVHFSVDQLSHPEKLNYADGHLALTEAIKDDLSLVVDGPVSVVYNPVDIEAEVIERSQNGCTNFLYMGRLLFDHYKCLKNMLEGLALVKGDWKLHFVGVGEEARCKEYAKDLGIEQHVIFHGWQADPWSYVKEQIKTIDCSLLTSESEGLPMFIIESMARGIPCIATSITKGTIEDHVNGWLFEFGDNQKMASLCQRLVDANPFEPGIVKATTKKFGLNAYFKRFEEAIK